MMRFLTRFPGMSAIGLVLTVCWAIATLAWDGMKAEEGASDCK
jgi:hypothetical protein